MPKTKRIFAEAHAEMLSFLRKPAAVFFTFVFPLILIGIFIGVIETQTADGFLENPQSYYLPGYLAFVVLLTPLSRISSTVARHRDKHRFEKLSSTPLTKHEWIAAHTIMNAFLISIAAFIITAVFIAAPGIEIHLSPWIPIYVFLGVAAFVGLGAIIGEIVDSEDGAIAMSNAVGFPMLFLADTFIPMDTLPGAAHPLISLLPLTYFSRGLRDATHQPPGDPLTNAVVLTVFAALLLVVASHYLPWRER